MYTYRIFEVGADATDAKADSPGSDGGIELHPGNPSPSLVPPSFSPLSISGSTLEYSVDADGADGTPEVDPVAV